jgi:hypothetical protein
MRIVASVPPSIFFYEVVYRNGDNRTRGEDSEPRLKLQENKNENTIVTTCQMFVT